MTFTHSAINITGRKSEPVGAGAQSGVLTPGVYDVWGDDEAFIKAGPVADDVTSADGYRVPAGQTISVRITRAGDRIGSTAAIKIHQVE